MRRSSYKYLSMLALCILIASTLVSLLKPQATVYANGTEPSGSNIAVGKTATADSQQSSQPASRGNDGDASTYWCANDGNNNHWWKVDLRNYHNLTGAAINFGVTQYYQYRIEVSSDNTNWTTVANQTGNTNTDAYQNTTFTASNTRYVRVTITGKASGQWACFAEFKVYATSKGTNVALGKTVTTDSQEGNNPASAAVDGTIDTRWSANNSNTNHWITVDLKYIYNLVGTQLTWEFDGRNYRYRIETSLNNSSWTTVVDQTQSGNTSQVRYHTFGQTKARYVRVTVTGLPNTSTWASIRELEIYQPFMKGADVSILSLMEANGAQFYDNGVRKEFLQLLKDNGINYIRLRLWVNPANSPQNQPTASSLASVKAMATRIKALGLQFFLDFHYSDTWADPGHQTVPAAWSGQSASQISQSVYNYTKDVITQLKNQNTLPDMVQIGNEINCGMIWNTGKVCSGSSNWSTFASYLNAGINGVNDALSSGQTVRIALHYAGGDPQWWLNSVISNGVTNFDTIALSYYTIWHGNLSTLTSLIPNLRSTYGRDVILAEYAYPWTLQNFDNTGNSVTSANGQETYYPVSAFGQQELVKDQLAIVKATGGLGAFYWEPGWYPVSGAGWIGGQGDGWENMAQVDQNGNTLSSLRVNLRY